MIPEPIEIPRAFGPEDVRRAAQELTSRLTAAAAPLGAALSTEAGWRKLAFHLIAHHAPRPQIAALLNDPQRLATFPGIGGPDLPAPCRVALQLANQHEPACRIDFSGRGKWFRPTGREGRKNDPQADHYQIVKRAFAEIVSALADGRATNFTDVRTQALRESVKRPTDWRRQVSKGTWREPDIKALQRHLAEFEEEMRHVAADQIRAEYGDTASDGIEIADAYRWFAAPDYVIVEREDGRTRVRLVEERRRIEPPIDERQVDPADEAKRREKVREAFLELHEELREANLARDWLKAVNAVADAAARLLLVQ